MKKNVVKKDISLQYYADCLFEERKFKHTMQTIGSVKHQRPYDDKQYLMDDGVSSLPYSHFSLL